MLEGYGRNEGTDHQDIFRIDKEKLSYFFMKKYRDSIEPEEDEGEHHYVQPRESLNILEKCGFGEGLCQLLATNMVSGINGDKNDVKRRQKKFGKHKIQMPIIDSFYTLCAR